MVMTHATGPGRPLPVPRDRFFDRDREHAAIGELLADPQVPLVTLTGPAGVGKSRLAVQVADRLRGGYVDGAAFAPFETVPAPELVLPAIAGALGVPEAGEGALYERLVDWLRGRQLLIVLDGLEHLTAAGPILADLLAACPGMQALATSRSPLRISGERELAVPPLPLPDPSTPQLAALAANPSVALFVARAQAVNRDFALHDRNAAAVAEVCRRLDGLPLALELAAARARALSVWEIRDQLDGAGGRLALLDDGARDQPERLRSLRAAIAWSDDQLPPHARALFRRLAVFTGGWDLDAALAVAGAGGLEEVWGRLGAGDEALAANGPTSPQPPAPSPSSSPSSVVDALTELLDHGLIVRVERPSLRGYTETRYAMLETIREFALERLDAEGGRDEAERRHTARCLAFAEAAATGMNGPDQADWLHRLEAEQPNLRAALLRLHRAGDCRTGLRLAAALGPFWRANGHFDDARWLRAFLELDAAERPPGREDPALAPVRAAALRWAGEIAGLQGDARTAVGYLKESLVRYRALGDRSGATAAAGAMGIALVMRGSPEAVEQSIPCLEEAIALHRELGDDRRAAFLQVYLGYAVGHLRDPERGARLTEDAEDYVRSLGEARRSEVGVGLLLRGWLALVGGDRARARGLLEECLTLAGELGSAMGEAGARAGLGWEALARGDREEAATHLQTGLDLSGRIGYRLGLAINLQGCVRLAAGGRTDRRRVARLAGAVEAFGSVGRLLLSGPLLAAYERDLAAIRDELGTTTFEAERAQGRRLRPELAVAEALALVARDAGVTGDPTRPDLPRLTPREKDVLRLLGERLANREIAETLAMCVRTVETHVQHVCDKLGVRGRRAAVDRARQLGLI
jgi:predicted ATPase/DNA-binding CsgD family transcriptional regulator